MLEPILLNPNGYKNIHHILKQLKIFAEWVLIDFDRPPYCLASGILKSSPDEFDFSTLVAGLGDLHMNRMKTILSIAEDILLEQ